MLEATIAPEVRGRALTGPEGPQIKDAKGKVDVARNAEAESLRTVTTARGLAERISSSEANRMMRRGRGEAAIQRNGTGVSFDEKGNLVFNDDATPESRARATSELEADQRVRKVIESGKGLEGLKSKEYRYVKEQVESAIRSTRFAAYFNSLDEDGRIAMINDILKNPNATNTVKVRYGEVTERKLEDLVSDAKLRAENARASHQAAVKRQALVATQLTGSETALQMLREGKDPAQVIRELEAKRPQVEIDRIDQQIKLKEAEYLGYVQGLARRDHDTSLPSMIATAKGELKTLYDSRKALSDNLETISSLKSDRKELVDKIERLRREQIDSERELQQTEAENRSADQALDRAQRARNQLEAEYGSDYRNILKDGIMTHLEAEDALQTQVEAEHLAEIAKTRRGTVDGELAQWKIRTFFIKGKPTRRNPFPAELNKPNTKKYMGMIMDPEHGPREMLEEALESNKSLTKEQREALLRDKEFTRQNEEDLVVQTLAAFIRSGGIITPEMALYINSQSWGEDIIEKAAARGGQEKKEEQEEKLKKLGVYKKESRKKAAGGLLASLIMGAFSSVISTVKSSGPTGGGSRGIS